MLKKARPIYWDKIERGLKGVKNLPGPVHALLGNRDRLKFHPSVPAGANANAKAYVTTEDTNEDGNIETVNIVVTNLEKEWPQDVLSKINQMDESDPVFQEVIKGVAKTLIHELAHISDHKDGSFPGGEAIAESQENAFEPIFASSTINKDNKVNLGSNLNAKGDIKVKSELIRLANHLDSIGHSDLADRLDSIVKSAQVVGGAEPMTVPNPGTLDAGQELEESQKGETVDVPEEVSMQVTEKVEEENEREGGTGIAAITNQTSEANDTDKLAKMIASQFSVKSGIVNR